MNNKRNRLLTALIGAIASLHLSAVLADDSMLAGDKQAGEKLHAANCTTCHGTEVYTRKDRRIKSLEALQARVGMCDKQLKRGLSADELTHITKYLNASFYKFSQ